MPPQDVLNPTDFVSLDAHFGLQVDRVPCSTDFQSLLACWRRTSEWDSPFASTLLEYGVGAGAPAWHCIVVGYSWTKGKVHVFNQPFPDPESVCSAWSSCRCGMCLPCLSLMPKRISIFISGISNLLNHIQIPADWRYPEQYDCGQILNKVSISSLATSGS